LIIGIIVTSEPTPIPPPNLLNPSAVNSWSKNDVVASPKLLNERSTARYGSKPSGAGIKLN